MKIGNKKISEKAILLTLVLILVMGTSVAVLVNYISNKMDVAVNVQTPLEIKVQEGLVDPASFSGSLGPITFADIYQGGEVISTVDINNRAQKDITGGIYFIIGEGHSYLSIDGSEFDAIGVRMWTGTAWTNWGCDCTSLAGGETNGACYQGVSGECFADIKSALGAISGNPITLSVSSGITYLAGQHNYIQLAIKTHSGSGTAIAPDIYRIHIQAQP